MDKGILLNKKSTRTEETLHKHVLSAYDKWDTTLIQASSLYDLLEDFPSKDNFSLEFQDRKKDIRKSLNPIIPGEEIIIMWLTTDAAGFRPTLNRFPGPKINRNLITSWLHDCKLLWVETPEDQRPTRLFSDRDCRIHYIYPRND